MPDYDHECQSEECKYFWEETYSIKVEPPKVCPKCGKETAKRVISLTGKGVVELSGNDLVDQVKNDAKQIQRDASKNENLYSNLIGSDRYENIQKSLDAGKRYRK